MALPRGNDTILDSIPSRPEALRFISPNAATPTPRTAPPTAKTPFDSPIALEFDQLCLQREARRRRRRSAPVLSLSPSQAVPADVGVAETQRSEVESECDSAASTNDEYSDDGDAEEHEGEEVVRGRSRVRGNGARPRRPDRKSLDEGMLDFLHKVKEKGQRGRYTAVRTLLAPVKSRRGSAVAEGGEGVTQRKRGGGNDTMEAELVDEGIIEPADRRGSVKCIVASEEDSDSSVDSRIERNLRTAVQRSELLVEGFADVVKQIEVAEIGEGKREELMEELLDRMPPEGPF